jgi:transposase
MVLAQRPAKLKAAMADILENAETDLTPQMRSLINMLWEEWKLVKQQIELLNDELERISAADPGCTRIRQIPGIGPVVATAMGFSTLSLLHVKADIAPDAHCGNSS